MRLVSAQDSLSVHHIVWCVVTYVNTIQLFTKNLDPQNFNSLPTVTRYCIVTRITVIFTNEAVKTMCCALRFISPVVNQLKTSSKKQWIALGFA